MSSGNFDLTTYYAKRIIGDAAAATAANALLQTGDDITSNIWILYRTNRTTEKYGIHYAYDGTNGHDKIEFYGKGTSDDATAWVQLDTGDASFNNINSYGTITTMTLFLKNTTTDLTQSNNGSSNTIYHSIWGADKNNKTWFCVEGYTNSSGSVAAFLGVRNYNTEGVAQSWKGFTITEDKSNNLTYTVSDPHAFRSAISTWALVSDSYNTFMPADGTTNGWYKFGTSNTSYGILPSTNGGAGNGHNYIGTSTWYWKYSHIDEMYGRNLTISGNNNGINFAGTKATLQMIRFIDADDEWGHGIVIGGGGLTILGSGEAANTLFNNVGATGATETTYISSDNTIEFLPTQQNGYDVSAHFTMTDGRFWAGVNGNTTRETSVGAQSGAGQIYMWSHAATSGSRGIYVPAHGTGAAKTVLSVDTNNNVAFYGGQFIGNGKSSSWIKGRDNAIFKVSTISDYSPAISIKTTNGSWEIGTYNYTGYYDDLVFSYCTDTNYNANSNSAVQLKFTEEGHFHSKTIHVHPSTSSYTEGVRIYPYSGWSTIMLGGNDLTAETGTSANSWGIFNNNGTLYINNNASSTAKAARAFATANGWTFGNTSANSYALNSTDLCLTGGIYYAGTKQTYRMIRFIDNTAGTDGNGISIGGGGLTILGSGESADTLFSNVGATGGTETTYISSDGNIEFLATQQNGYDASARIWMTASVLNIGVDGNTTRESSVNVYSGAGRIQLYSAASATGNRGLWVAAHGTGAAKNVILVDTNNNVTLNGTATNADTVDSWHRDDIRKGCLSFTRNINSANPSNLNDLSDGMAYNYGGTTYWQNAPSGSSYGGAIALTSGGAITLGMQFFWDVNHNSSSSTRYLWFRVANNLGWQNDWKLILDHTNYSSYAVAKTGSTMSGTLAIVNNTQNSSYNALLYIEHKSGNDWGIIVNKNNASDYGIDVQCTSTGSYGIRCSGRITGTTVYGAVWNDYAEYRQGAVTEGGYCVHESPDGTMRKSTERLEAGCRITSDTFGFAIGETEKCKTPIAVSGRVLVYPYRAREDYPLGAAVCSAPGGTVDIMTRDEIMLYPERIVGTVSEIPTYEIWESGQGKDDILNHRPVNGRIWIYVR